MSALARLAARAPVPVFPAVGRGGLLLAERLGLSPDIRLVASPRHALILLVAGDPAPESRVELARVHDQLPHPRATVWFGAVPLFDRAVAVVPREVTAREVAARVAALHAGLLAGERASEPDLLPDRPPAPFRGVGPHGQGGEGMMGGRPYGRPMPMTDEDIRDGLALDAYAVTVGPFLPALPPGFSLSLVLQGDVIVRAKPLAPPLPQDAAALGPAFALARLLRLVGLPLLAGRLARAGLAAAEGRPVAGRALGRAIRLSGALLAIPERLATTADGTDARARARRWLDMLREGRGAPHRPEPVAADTLLPGLEWQEAMIALASLDLAALRPAAAWPADGWAP